MKHATLKKAIVLLLTSVMSLLPVFAGRGDMKPEADNAYGFQNRPWTIQDARISAMGGAGLSAPSSSRALYVNPAALGESAFSLSFPQVSFTLYSVRDLIATGIMNEKDVAGNIGSYATDLLRIYGKAGYGSVARMDAGVFSMRAGHFALGADMKLSLDSYAPASDSMAVSVIPSADMVFSAGLGFRLFSDSPVSLDVGATVRMDTRIYMESQELKGLITGGEKDFAKYFSESVPAMIGVSVPVDAGMRINIPCGFSASAVVRNINGNFSGMRYASSLREAGKKEFTEAGYVIESPLRIDAGFAWDPDLGMLGCFLQPCIAVDVTDLQAFSDGFSTETFLRRLHAGVEVRILTLAELRAGIDGGYITLGAGFNLLKLIHAEVSYHRAEFGRVPGEKNTDALTVRFNLGWE